MPTRKIAITVEKDLVKEIDKLVEKKAYPNRSKAIQYAIRKAIKEFQENNFKEECSKLDAYFEQNMAEESIKKDISQWPEY